MHRLPGDALLELACRLRASTLSGATVSNLKNIFSFARIYLGRYWGRLLIGVLAGVVFGLANGSFIWATSTLTDRLMPQSQPALVEKTSRAPQMFKEQLKVLRTRVDEAIDPWLPRAGVKITWRHILGGVLFLPVLVSLRSFSDYVNGYCLGWVSERVINDLRVDVLTKLNSLSLNYFNRSTTGDMLTRINTDTANLHSALKTGGADLVKEPFTVLSVITVLCLIDWKLTLLVVVFFPLYILPLAVLGKKARLASRAGRGVDVGQSSLLVEFFSSIRVVKAFSLEEQQMKRFRDYSRQLVRYGMKGVQAKELVKSLIEVISVVGLGAVLVYTFWSGRTVPDLFGFLTGLIILLHPIKKLAAIHVLFEQAGAGVERLVEILKEQPSVMEPARPKPLAGFTTALTLENISFSYGDRLVLHEVNLALPRGRKLGVAGESGSGKSTLVNLVFRFYDPTSGAIKIDGLDLRDVSGTDLRRQMALVSQEIVLFDMTVAENIACGKPGATRAEIEAAARAAFAHDFILQLPQGYDSRVGERGVTLSGGQRQRVAIARAFIRNAPILVLDEATASLDSQSEAEVQTAIERLEENRTVICVAHRLSTLAAMDHIIVLTQGRIVEQGSFQELLAADGTFAAMARRQGIVSA